MRLNKGAAVAGSWVLSLFVRSLWRAGRLWGRVSLSRWRLQALDRAPSAQPANGS